MTHSADKDAGPECDTCGKTTCPDAALPEFSEPRECIYGPIYHALKDSKDCDYGCARDYTNQAVRLWVVDAVEGIIAARVREALGAIRSLELDLNADADYRVPKRYLSDRLRAIRTSVLPPAVPTRPTDGDDAREVGGRDDA
jgi:hypothetical protein